VQRVGSPVPRKVDVRVIAATNRPLRALAAQGQFRDDLYYRLAMVEITLPSPIERREDLPLLERFLVEKFSVQYGKPIVGITRRAQARLASYSWPGNVRELENVIGNAALMAEGSTIDLNDLPENVTSLVNSEAEEDQKLISLEEVQTRYLIKVLKQVGGNKARAAEILGVSRTTVYEMLAKIQKKQMTSVPVAMSLEQ